MPPLLEIQDLHVSFAVPAGRLTAVQGVSLAVQPAQNVGVVGESGCGKSVTALSILRLLPVPPGRYDGGRILFRDQDLLRLPLPELRAIRGRQISMIFQEPMTALSPLQRVGDQLAEAVLLHDAKCSPRSARERGVEWLGKVGIPDPAQRARSFPFELSGGMRQRVMIAMALLWHPALIIADEPTTAIDVTIQAQIFDLIRRMKESDTSLLLITHDMGVVWELCDRVIIMYAAQVVEEGAVKEIFRHPRHPYTQGLLAAMPRLAQPGARLPAIEGQVPSLTRPLPGCHFADRCPFVFPRCRVERPALTSTPHGGQVRCFKAQEEIAASRAAGMDTSTLTAAIAVPPPAPPAA